MKEMFYNQGNVFFRFYDGFIVDNFILIDGFDIN